MSARFARLLDDGSGDMQIICIDDPRAPPISAHRAFLSSASDSLRTLLSLQLDGSSQQYAPAASPARAALPRLTLHGIKASTMRAVLRYIYTGAVGLDVGNAVDLLVASEKFGLEALEGRVVQFLPRVLRDDNVCAVLTTAAECVCTAALGARASGPPQARSLPHARPTHTAPFPLPPPPLLQQPRLFPAGGCLLLPAAPL